jgi:hypothetical protein
MLQCSSWHRLAAEAEALRKFQLDQEWLGVAVTRKPQFSFLRRRTLVIWNQEVKFIVCLLIAHDADLFKSMGFPLFSEEKRFQRELLPVQSDDSFAQESFGASGS